MVYSIFVETLFFTKQCQKALSHPTRVRGLKFNKAVIL